jgi:hypothetical protein
MAAFDLIDHPESSNTHIVERLARGMARAAEAIDSGAAVDKLAAWALATQSRSHGGT